MNLVIGKVDWKNWEKLWLDPGIQLQFAVLIGLILLVFVLTKITKPLLLGLSKDSAKNDLVNYYGETWQEW